MGDGDFGQYAMTSPLSVMVSVQEVTAWFPAHSTHPPALDGDTP